MPVCPELPEPPVEPLLSGTQDSDALWTGTLLGTEIAVGVCPAGSSCVNVSVWPSVVTTVTVQVWPAAVATGTASIPRQVATAHTITSA